MTARRRTRARRLLSYLLPPSIPAHITTATDCECRRPPGAEGASKARPDRLARPAGQRGGDHTWATEPGVGRVVNGVPTAVDRAAENARIHALGNAVVPQVAEYVGRLIVEHARAAA